jgi:XTP/dITP diphosphohydrolase
MKIVLATHNRHKRQELTTLLRNLEVEILTLEDFPAIGEIEETGETLEENSLIKAQTVHHLTGFPAVADDTGLEVRALNGAPGVRSARYAGKTTIASCCRNSPPYPFANARPGSGRW